MTGRSAEVRGVWCHMVSNQLIAVHGYVETYFDQIFAWGIADDHDSNCTSVDVAYVTGGVSFNDIIM